MSKEFWENRWQTNKTGWDLGEISPPLLNYINQLTNKELKILIPGCGNAYEAEYLYANGFKNTFIVPINDWNVLSDAVIKTPIGGKHVTQYLTKLFAETGYAFTTYIIVKNE